MKKQAYLFIIPFVFVLTFTQQGCFRHDPVRHLSSDVCLIVPHLTSRQDVLSFLGPPDRTEKRQDNSEVWYYYHANKSLLRKTPLIGDKLGSEKYDVVAITFSGDRVSTCAYRSLSEKGFNDSGIGKEE